MSRRLAIFLVLLSAVGFGSVAMFAKLAYGAGVSTAVVLALRFLLAAAFLAPIIWIKRISLPRGRLLAGFILMGVLYTAQAQSYFTALRYASSGLVGLLLYVYPVLVTVLALLLGWERLERRTLVLLVLAVMGLGVTLGGQLHGQPFGIFLGLLAAVIYAVYILTGGKLTPKVHPLAATFVVLASAAFFNGGLALAGGGGLPHGATAWLAIAAIALFATVLAIAAFLAGIKHIGAAQASIVSTMEPVITIGLGVALLGETVSTSQMLGGAMVLTAVILLATRPPQPALPRQGSSPSM
ncbi:MAG TPA: DMT family transporter [Paucimonas sp.]|nr:DMT family transporter [Paucimonas sp.]